MAVTKRKRVSKKKKVSWRKHVNIEDVENFLEDKRLEERLGKPVTDKTNEELFTLDTSPSAKPVLTSKQKRRMLLREQLPKCYSMLKPHTEVPDPVIKRNRVRTKEERKNELLKKKEENRRSQGIFKAKDLQAQKDRQLYQTKRANTPKDPEFNVDIWNSEAPQNEIISSQWIENRTKRHTLRGTGKFTKAVPKSVHGKKSVTPSVEPPHPGTSYNPTFADHQALLQSVAEKETKIIKEEDHLNRVTRGMFNKVTSVQNENNWVVEMSEGLTNNVEVEKEDETEFKSINPPVQNKKKNLKQRRKQKEQQKLLQIKKSAKKEKKKVADMYKLKFIKEQINKDEKKAEVLKTIRVKKETLKRLQPKRLGSIKFQEEEIEFNMPEDLGGKLRNVKKAGNPLMDRFKSMQKRNILEPTARQLCTRAKIKRFKKAGHKDDWKVTVARSTSKLQ